jgi:8-oxo-dGTP pyrophosphatase MutT (NUDIX family)
MQGCALLGCRVVAVTREGEAERMLAQPEVIAEQYAAVPWQRHRGGVRLLLITSRISRKWLIPKGWLVPGLSASASACREAFEEAGVEGAAGGVIGAYDYVKVTGSGTQVPCRVTVFAMEVERLCETWPEVKQRTRQWFGLKEASTLVSEPGLRELLSALRPEQLTG